MNANAQRLADERLDERILWVRKERVKAREQEIRDHERTRMSERLDCEVRTDDTGFTPGARGLI